MSHALRLFALAILALTLHVLPAGAQSGALSAAAPAADDFTIVKPTAASTFEIGGRIKTVWTSPDAAPARVNLYLRKGDEAFALIYNGPNLDQPDFGAAAYVVPEGTAIGDDYQVRVEDEADASVFGESERFSIVEPYGAFTFQNPVAREKVGLGTIHTITWTSPPGAPAGDVYIELSYTYRDENGVRQRLFITALTTPNDGSEPFSFDLKAPYGQYYFTIESVDEPVYQGRSPYFYFDFHEVSSPVAGEVWTEGETRTITWEHPLYSPQVAAKVYLRRPGSPAVVLAATTPDDGDYTFTVPAGLPTASDYRAYVGVRVYGGHVFRAWSLPFTINGTGAAPMRAVALPHFTVTTPARLREAMLTVEAAGLADGAEVGVFAGRSLIGAGVVADGRALVSVAGEILIGALVENGVPAADDFVTVEDGSPLTLRAFAGGVETALPVAAVRDADAPMARAVSPLVFVDGGTFEVETALGVAVPGEAASGYALSAASPNPFASATRLQVTVPVATAVRVEVLDVLGRQVATLADGPAEAGTHTVRFDGSALPSGTYVVRMTAGPHTRVQRVTLLN